VAHRHPTVCCPGSPPRSWAPGVAASRVATAQWIPSSGRPSHRRVERPRMGSAVDGDRIAHGVPLRSTSPGGEPHARHSARGCDGRVRWALHRGSCLWSGSHRQTSAEARRGFRPDCSAVSHVPGPCRQPSTAWLKHVGRSRSARSDGSWPPRLRNS
jgi:hypothetical protein